MCKRCGEDWGGYVCGHCSAGGLGEGVAGRGELLQQLVTFPANFPTDFLKSSEYSHFGLR